MEKVVSRRMKKTSFLICALSVLTSLIALLVVPLSASAAGPTGDFSLSTTYPSIVAGKGQDINFPIDVINKGNSDTLLDISVVSAPKGWQTTLKDRGYGIRSLDVLAGKTQSLSLQVTPPADATVGDNKVVLQAVSSDGAKSTLELNIGIQEKPVGGIKLATMYPVLRGPTTSKFEFKVDVKNEGDQDRTVGLSVDQPQDWQVAIQPAYDQKQISSMQVKAGETQGVNIEITPSTTATPGQYPITLQASAGNASDAIKMNVVLLGNTELAVTTDSGRLNTNATAGQLTTISLVVTNKGSADLGNISLLSDKPSGWEVTFVPDKIDSLAAGQSRQVNVGIKPSDKAIAGDYVVGLTASSGSTSDKAQMRVTVETSTLWGWAGILLVVIVVAGLGGLFTRLGRR